MKILVGIDFSDTTEKILAFAGKIVARMSAKVWLLHVAAPDPDFVGFEVGPQSVRDSNSRGYHQEHREIQENASRLRAMNIDATAILVQGETVETILHEASKLDVDMIIIGSHGRASMHDFLVGSVSREVLRKSDLPILLVPTHI